MRERPYNGAARKPAGGVGVHADDVLARLVRGKDEPALGCNPQGEHACMGTTPQQNTSALVSK